MLKVRLLKCVDNKGNDFLTVGEIYESDNVNPLIKVCITDDEGCGIKSLTLDNPFGKFEVINE